MKNKGFSLIELLVIISIISIISAVIFANFRETEKQFALQRSVHKLAQDIRTVQAMAMAMQEFEGDMPNGYGIYLHHAGSGSDDRKYILFADFNGNNMFDDDDKIVKEIRFERGVFIEKVEISGPPPRPNRPALNIFFSPPDPTVTINSRRPGLPGNFEESDGILIILNYKEDSDETKRIIQVNKAGLIEIQ